MASQVICLQEVHLSTLQNLQCVFLNSEIIASLRPHSKKGGNATIIGSAVTVIASTTTDYGAAVHIRKGTTNVLLADIYIPPESSKYAPSTLEGYEQCLSDIQNWVHG